MRLKATVILLILATLGVIASCLRVESNNDASCRIRRRAGQCRRTFLQHSVVLVVSPVLGASSTITYAAEPPLDLKDDDDGKKPFAPLQALLPATRCKIWVDGAFELSTKLDQEDPDNRVDTMIKLNDILSHPPKLFTSESIRNKKRGTTTTTTPSTAQITTSVSSVNKNQYKINREGLSIPDRISAMLNQADVERQWGMLQYAESKREGENEVRAAFNYYTSQLEFSYNFLLTGSKEEKKRLIRNDELPTPASVITSDLDLRDLYRNEFLTALEDVQAEVAYQTKQIQEQSSDVTTAIDIVDTVELMKQAHTACSNWFSLIPCRDVQEAMDVIATKEEIQTR